MIEDFTNKVNKPFHSSGYAEVASGSSIGTTSSQSFRQRYQVDRNRQYISRYHASHLANAPMLPPKASDGTQLPGERRGYAPSRPIAVPPPRTQRFQEPPNRGYNPYG